MNIAIIVLACVVLALAVLRWGVNSTHGTNSTEWERRQYWYGFHEKEVVWAHAL